MIIEAVGASTLGVGQIAGLCAAVLATVIVVRLVWVSALQVPLVGRGVAGASPGRTVCWPGGPACGAW